MLPSGSVSTGHARMSNPSTPLSPADVATEAAVFSRPVQTGACSVLPVLPAAQQVQDSMFVECCFDGGEREGGRQTTVKTRSYKVFPSTFDLPVDPWNTGIFIAIHHAGISSAWRVTVHAVYTLVLAAHFLVKQYSKAVVVCLGSERGWLPWLKTYTSSWPHCLHSYVPTTSALAQMQMLM